VTRLGVVAVLVELAVDKTSDDADPRHVRESVVRRSAGGDLRTVVVDGTPVLRAGGTFSTARRRPPAGSTESTPNLSSRQLTAASSVSTAIAATRRAARLRRCYAR